MAARPYKARNKRIIHRSGNGRFRHSTLADIGMAECEQCGAIFTPDLSKFKNQLFVDPRELRDIRKLCPACSREATEYGKALD